MAKKKVAKKAKKSSKKKAAKKRAGVSSSASSTHEVGMGTEIVHSIHGDDMDDFVRDRNTLPHNARTKEERAITLEDALNKWRIEDDEDIALIVRVETGPFWGWAMKRR